MSPKKVVQAQNPYFVFKELIDLLSYYLKIMHTKKVVKDIFFQLRNKGLQRHD